MAILKEPCHAMPSTRNFWGKKNRCKCISICNKLYRSRPGLGPAISERQPTPEMLRQHHHWHYLRCLELVDFPLSESSNDDIRECKNSTEISSIQIPVSVYKVK